MIDLNDKMQKARKSNPKKMNTYYRCYCDVCGADRGYKSKSRAKRLCKSCSGKLSHNHMSEETRAKMSKAKKDFVPWNKGKVGISEETRAKLSKAKSGLVPYNKGQKMTHKQKVKISCSVRGIETEDFEDFIMTESHRARGVFGDSGLKQECLEKADHTCDIYGVKGNTLNVHHKNSWKHFPEERYNETNLVCISEDAHKTFHNLYGNGKNIAVTSDQYEEFKTNTLKRIEMKQDLFLIAGTPASGKTWVCSQLMNKFNYVPYDGTLKYMHVHELLLANDKPLLYDPTIKISTFTKRYGHLFNIRLIVIQETKETIIDRMNSRGGRVTKTIDRRIRRMEQLSIKAEFTGTASEVFNYLET